MSDIKSFEIVTSANARKTNLLSGHATVVRPMKSLTSDIVVKEHKETAGSETDADRLFFVINTVLLFVKYVFYINSYIFGVFKIKTHIFFLDFS